MSEQISYAMFGKVRFTFFLSFVIMKTSLILDLLVFFLEFRSLLKIEIYVLRGVMVTCC